MQTFIDLVNSNQYLIAAHRGASGMFAENTITAFQKAIEMKADIIEIDIRNTIDNEIICYHDNNFHNDIAISDIYYEKLIEYNVPLLRDVLQEFGNKIHFVIEIKLLVTNIFQHFIYNLMSIIETLKLNDNIVIASEVPKYLSLVKNITNNKIKTAWVYNANIINAKNNYDAIICSIAELEKIEQNNNIIGVYGVNSLEDVRKCIKNNVKIIGTDYILEIRKYLKQLEK